MIDLTPDQKVQAESWAFFRDTKTQENAILLREFNRLTIANKELSDSNTELETRISGHQGRIEILDKKEQERELLLSQSVSKLLSKETELVAKTSGLQTEVNALVGRKGDLESMIKTLEDLHDKIFDKIGVLGQVVDHVKRVGAENTNAANYLMSDVKKTLGEISGNLKDLNEGLKNKSANLDQSVEKVLAFHRVISGDITKVVSDQDTKLG